MGIPNNQSNPARAISASSVQIEFRRVNLGRTLSASQQEDNQQDDQQKAEAATIVMIGSASIETAAAEQENQDNQDDYETHRSLLLVALSAFQGAHGQRGPMQNVPPG